MSVAVAGNRGEMSFWVQKKGSIDSVSSGSVPPRLIRRRGGPVPTQPTCTDRFRSESIQIQSIEPLRWIQDRSTALVGNRNSTDAEIRSIDRLLWWQSISTGHCGVGVSCKSPVRDLARREALQQLRDDEVSRRVPRAAADTCPQSINRFVCVGAANQPPSYDRPALCLCLWNVGRGLIRFDSIRARWCLQNNSLKLNEPQHPIQTAQTHQQSPNDAGGPRAQAQPRPRPRREPRLLVRRPRGGGQ